jgi:hypothetical protein
MNSSYGARAGNRRWSREAGGSRLNLLAFALIFAVVAYSGYQYVPVALQAYQFKDYMQETVNRGAALGKDRAWIEQQLRASSNEFGVPPNALMEVQMQDGRMQAHVQYTRSITLPGYLYQYNFDETVMSSTFLTTR